MRFGVRSPPPHPPDPSPPPETGDRDVPRVGSGDLASSSRVPRACLFLSGPHPDPEPGGAARRRRGRGERPARTPTCSSKARGQTRKPRSAAGARGRVTAAASALGLSTASGSVREAPGRRSPKHTKGRGQKWLRMSTGGGPRPEAPALPQPRRAAMQPGPPRRESQSPCPPLPGARTPETKGTTPQNTRRHNTGDIRGGVGLGLNFPPPPMGHARPRPCPSQSQSASSGAVKPPQGPIGKRDGRANETAALHLNDGSVALSAGGPQTEAGSLRHLETRCLETESPFGFAKSWCPGEDRGGSSLPTRGRDALAVARGNLGQNRLGG